MPNRIAVLISVALLPLAWAGSARADTVATNVRSEFDASHDGDVVLYYRGFGNKQALFLRRGTHHERLITSSFAGGALSGDGRRVVFSTASQTADGHYASTILDVGSGRKSTLRGYVVKELDESGHYAIASNGHDRATSQAREGILNLKTHRFIPAPKPPKGFGRFPAALSADASTALWEFTANRYGHNTHRWLTQDRHSGRWKYLTIDGIAATSGALSANGSLALAAARGTKATGDDGLFLFSMWRLFNRSTGQITAVPQVFNRDFLTGSYATAPALAPDGATIGFSCGRQLLTYSTVDQHFRLVNSNFATAKEVQIPQIQFAADGATILVAIAVGTPLRAGETDVRIKIDRISTTGAPDLGTVTPPTCLDETETSR